MVELKPSQPRSAEFPTPSATEDKIRAWLHKAVFWVELEEQASICFNPIFETARIAINWNANDSMDWIGPYVERHRIPLYEHAYSTFFGKHGSFDRAKKFLEQNGTQIAMQRVVYRYFHREMVRKGGLETRDLPKMLEAWTEESLDSFIFTPLQVKAFKRAELLACPWYLECRGNHAPGTEIEEKKAAGPCNKFVAVIDLTLDKAKGIEEEPEAKAKKGKGKGSKTAAPVRQRAPSTRQAASAARAANSPVVSNRTQIGSQNAPALSSANKVGFVPLQYRFHSGRKGRVLIPIAWSCSTPFAQQ